MGSESLNFFTIQLLNGMAYSLLIFLLAIGLSVVFGLMDVINLAHGSFYMLGAYLGMSLLKWSGNFWLAMVVAPLATALLGLVVEVLLLRPLYNRGHLDQVLLTFGFAFVVMDMTKWVWGADVHSLAPPPSLAGAVTVMGNQFPKYRLFVIGFGLVVALILYLIQEKTRLGAIVRAGVSDKEIVNGLGINITSVFSLVFAFGVGLAGLAGVVAGPVLGPAPGMDFDTLIITLIVVVVGGLGTFSGSFFGALLIGQADTFGKALFPDYSMFVVYAIMALTLILKPSGLFRKGGV